MKTQQQKTEQQKTDEFENLCGSIAKAQRLQYLWNNSYPCGTLYDMNFNTGRYHSRTEVFRAKAEAEGFTYEQITMFLSL